MSSDNIHLGIYLSEFQDILDIEIIAGGIYSYYVKNLQDPNLLKKFREIYEDKKEHVKITQGFIEIICGQYNPQNQQESA